ncbi:MAG: hypothetical protein HY791_37210 [Deltaproteobacteria bacterium]|nr:hypothetical protein [Deltaproteobacteria bacterium]
MRRTLLISQIALTACGPSTLWVELPSTRTSKALLLARHRLRARPTVRAISLEPAPERISAPELEEVEQGAVFEAVLYDSSLAELGFEEGLVEESGDSMIPTRGSTVLRLELDESPKWESVTGLSSALGELRYESRKRSGCLSMELDSLSLPVEGSTRFTLPLPSGSVLVGTNAWRLFDVVGSSIKEVRMEPTFYFYTGAIATESDHLWVAGSEGTLARGRLSEGVVRFENFPPNPRGGDILRIAVDEQGEATSVFTLTQDGSFDRFDGRAWQHLHDLTPTEPLANYRGIAVVGPDEAIAVTDTRKEVTRWRRNEISFESTPARGGLSSAAYLPGVGSIVGTVTGDFIADRGMGWTNLPGSKLELWATAIAPTESGFVYGSGFGNFGEFRWDDGFCPLIGAGFPVFHIAKYDHGFLVAGDNSSSGRVPLLWAH